MFLMALLSLSFAACSDDDDDDNTSLQGTTWINRSYSSEYIMFTSGNNGRWYEGREYDSFTYSYNAKKGGTIKVREYDSDDDEYETYTVRFTINSDGDELTVYDPDGGDEVDVYYKSTTNNED